MSEEQIAIAADELFEAQRTGKAIAPVRSAIGPSAENAYAVQSIITNRWVEQGRRIVGRKIGLTSAVVQAQLGVDQPDFGVLFADMEYADGAEIPYSSLLQPRAEGEIAIVLKDALPNQDVTYSELIRATDFVVPAIEIVSSRIANWDITFADTVADNASSGLYVLGSPKRSLDGLDLAGAKMVMSKNGRPVSYGAGVACLGHPLNAALWLARTCARLGAPLRGGDVVLTGALGPMVDVETGDAFEVVIDGVGAAHFHVSSD